MSHLSRFAVLSAILALLGVGMSGCIVEHDRGYRYDHGDRVDRYGHREAHWCDYHRGDEHCRY
jgi:hypothetical protein